MIIPIGAGEIYCGNIGESAEIILKDGLPDNYSREQKLEILPIGLPQEY